jgi:hypothetical protein
MNLTHQLLLNCKSREVSCKPVNVSFPGISSRK